MAKNKLILLCALIVVVILAIITTSKTTETIIKDHPLIGQTFVAGESALYMEDCNNFSSCGDTLRMKEINRSLNCSKLSVTAGLYNKSYSISDSTTFKLVELLLIESHGVQVGGGSNYVTAVLEDNNGLLSTVLFSTTVQMDKPYGFQNGAICPK